MKYRITLLAMALFLSPLTGQDSPRDLFRLGEERFKRSEDSLALEYFRQIAEDSPLSTYAADARFRMGQILYRSGDYPGAEREFRLVAERYRSTQFFRELPFWRGITAHGRQDYSGAVNFLDNYLQDPASPLQNEALLYKALALQAQGSLHSATVTLEKLIKSKEPYPGGYELTLLGNLYREQERFRSLRQLLDNRDLALFDAPWRDHLRFLKAEAAFEEDNPEAPELYLELTRVPGQIGAVSYQRLFGLLLKSGEVQELEQLLHRAERDLRNEPELLKDFWLRIGIAFYQEGQRERSDFYLKRVYALKDPQEPAPSLAVLYLARLAQGRGESRLAESLIDGYINQGGVESAELLFTLGELRTRRADYTGALDIWNLLQQNFPLSPTRAQASYYHGYCYYQMGDGESALKALEPLIQGGGASSEGLSGEYRLGLLRLTGNIYLQTGRYREAVDSWRQFSLLAPRDPSGRRQLLRALFLGGFHEELMAEALVLKRDGLFLGTSPDVGLLASYLSGLSALSLRKYTAALEELRSLQEKELKAVGWEQLYPYVLYYRGWALYRSGQYQPALVEFSSLINLINDSGFNGGGSLAGKAYYLAGWSGFQLKEYSRASDFFLAYPREGDQVVQSLLMGGRSLISQGDLNRAEEVLSSLITDFPDSSLEEDILFEWASVMAARGRAEEGAELFLKVSQGEGGLAEEALFRRAEVYQEAELWNQAQEAFYLYRRSYPRGDYADAAHYWGGEAALRGGEPFGAVLLWERLDKEFPSSPFRGISLWKSAGVYQDRGDYEKALNLLNRLEQYRPDEARSLGTSAKSQEIRYLMAGEGREVAALRAEMGSLGGAEDPEGRELVLELARILLYQGGSSREEARLLLEEILFYREEDPAMAARAQYYLGEYHQRRGQLDQAGRAFLEAATMNPGDRDLMAMAVFRAAEVALQRGDRRGAEALVRRLTENFPQSTWTEEGVRLLQEKDHEN